MLVKRGKCSQCGLICCPPCEHLLPNGKCRLKDKPPGCKAYPHNPFALEEGCTYYFEIAETGEKITASNLWTFRETERQSWINVFIPKSADE